MQPQLERILKKVQKPAKYIGGEPGSILKDKNKVNLRFAFCFPDTYEVGMSHLGMKILYSLLNSVEDIWCERVFAPWVDMEALMREANIPLYALESLDPISEFDVVGFTLQYELSFTNILNMLDLGGIPLHTQERDNRCPLIVAGGPCACNPEPLADFIDLFMLGDGEEVILELMDVVHAGKMEGISRTELLRRCAQIPGVYVPSLYEVTYHSDGTIQQVSPKDGAPAKVCKRIVADFDGTFYPENFVVPYVDVIHDRAVVEVLRGCIRGCRFCQAGFLYRPFREKTGTTINRIAKDLCHNTGYDEISLSSLSTSDHTQLEPMLTEMVQWTKKEMINLSLPSLRVDNFSKELLEQITSVRKSGLTFAPEAGTQRLRDVINKNVSEDEIMRTCRTAFEGGYLSVKLYFMLGLPTETEQDLQGIADTAQRVVDLFYSLPTKPKGKGVQVSVSCATFVPKPFTPFQFEPQATPEEITQKQTVLQHAVRSKKISLGWHDWKVSVLEGVLARGDRRLCRVVELAWKKGCTFDSWSEQYRFELWQQAMEESGLSMEFYAARPRAYDEVLPWDHLDYGVTKAFLIRENQKARAAQTTPNCKEKCAGCGSPLCRLRDGKAEGGKE